MIVRTLTASLAVTAALAAGAAGAAPAQAQARFDVPAVSTVTATPASFGTHSIHRGKNDKRSVKYLIAIKASGAQTPVNRGKYLPPDSKRIAAPPGNYRILAWNLQRGWGFCVDHKSGSRKLPTLNRTWHVQKGTCADHYK